MSNSPAIAPFLYDAFISYRHVERDRKWAAWLIEALEGYRVPRSLQAKGHPARLKKVFRDEDEMPASGDLNDQIKTALAASRFLIVVCSPYTPRSKWVEREIEIFKQLGRGDQVLALLIEGEPHDSFPAAVLERTRIIERPDGGHDIVREDTEPLAADVRPRKGVHESATKQQALLRLMACILGVSYDTLRQRERERRQRSWRAWRAAAAAVLVAAAGLGLAYWDYTRPKAAYYRNIVWRWGVPEGLGRLDEATRSHRGLSYRLVTQMGRVVVVRAENSAGVLQWYTDDNYDASNWVVSYQTDGRAESIKIFDRNGHALSQQLLGRDGNHMLVTFESGNKPLTQQASNRLFVDQNLDQANSERTKSEITRLALTFDPSGWPVERRFQDPWGSPGQDAEGSFGEKIAYSPEGLLVRRAKIGPDGAEIVGKDGVAAVAIGYDANLEVARRSLIGTSGALIIGPQGFATVVYGHDSAGNTTMVDYLGDSGKSLLNKQGYSSIKSSYDPVGNEIETSYFGIDMEPVVPKMGCAKTIRAYDSRGNRIERKCYGRDSKPALSPDGVFSSTYRFNDRDQNEELSFFGIDNKPVLNFEGYARVTRRFDGNGNIIEVSLFGTDGKLTTTIAGIASHRDRFDDAGNLIEQAYFGADGKPAALHRVGPNVVRVTFAYDQRGNRTDETYFGADGKPTLAKKGHFRLRWAFDARGNMIEQHLYGVDNLAVADADGVATTFRKFDERGNQTEVAYIGPTGAPATDKEGCARYTVSFDDRGNKLESRCFGLDGRPKPGNSQCAIVRWTFDRRNNRTSSSCFGVDGKPTPNKTGEVTTAWTYDDRGNQIAINYFGADENLVMTKRDFAKSERTFDERGKIASARFFDAGGRPIDLEVAVETINPGSQAEKLGLAVNDRLLTFDGVPIFASEVPTLTSNAAFGTSHQLTARRGAVIATYRAGADDLGVTVRLVRPGADVRLVSAPQPTLESVLNANRR